MRLVALKRLRYPRGVGGREYSPGEAFETVSDRDAHALKLVKAARDAEAAPVSAQPAAAPVAQAVPMTPPAPEPAAPPESAAPEQDSTSPRSRPENDPPVDSVDIPDAWRDLPYPKRRALAARLTPKPVTNRQEVDTAIETEMARRGTYNRRDMRAED